MPEWVSLDTSELNPGREESAQGVNFRVFMSPYEVPDGVRGFYDKGISRLVVEFRYPGKEARVSRDLEKFLSIVTGRNSGRLYRIEIDMQALGFHQVSLELLDKIGSELDDEVTEHESFKMASDILQRQGPRVLEQMRSSRKAD